LDNGVERIDTPEFERRRGAQRRAAKKTDLRRGLTRPKPSKGKPLQPDPLDDLMNPPPEEDGPSPV
jgi:hypothetical protein